MTGRFMSTVVALGAALSFETPEIMAISDETLAGFYVACPKLERYRRYLTDLRRKKAHVLSPAEEKLLAAAGELSQTPDTIYGMFADADLKFADALDTEGNPHVVSQATFVPIQSGADRVLRKNAYESLYKGFGNFQNTAAAILNAQNKQLKFFAEARHYENAFEAALFNTNVPTSVYLNLIESVHKHMDKMHRYVRLRKKLLGVDEVHIALEGRIEAELPGLERGHHGHVLGAQLIAAGRENISQLTFAYKYGSLAFADGELRAHHDFLAVHVVFVHHGLAGIV